MPWNATLTHRIMLVEDDPVHARIMKRAFEHQPMCDEIVHLSDGESALASLFDDRASGLASNASAGQSGDGTLPCIILLDLRLPGVDGIEVLQAIRSHERTRKIPVIIISTSERQADISRCYQMGASAYITKPVDYTRFMDKLRLLRAFWLEAAELPEDRP